MVRLFDPTKVDACLLKLSTPFPSFFLCFSEKPIIEYSRLLDEKIPLGIPRGRNIY